jgi:hypothetical protein
LGLNRRYLLSFDVSINLRLLFLSDAGRSAVESVKSKVMGLLNYRERRTGVNLDVFSNPQRHLICLPVEKIVADTKVFPEAIEKYKRKIQHGQKLSPVIVVKHPHFDVYAVLDGHHRFYAYVELGRKEIECALAGDFSSVFFFLTEHGYFQPNPNAKELKEPEIKLHDGLEGFLKKFLKSPKAGVAGHSVKNKQS